MPFLPILLFCLSIFAGTPAVAQPYEVSNIAVDVEGENAMDARTKALNKARRDGFHILTTRMLDAGERASLPDIDDATIATMVNDFEINREKYSKNRYLASVNIRFNPHAVQGFLGRYTNMVLPDRPNAHGLQTPYDTHAHSYPPMAGQSIPPQEPAVRQGIRLVLPWFSDGIDTTLWKEPNPWRTAWNEWVQTAQARSLNLITPIGDITDMQAFNPEKPLSFDQSGLDKLLQRYHADQAIIAIADPMPNGMIRVSLYQSTNMTPRYMDRIVASGGAMRGENRFLPAIWQSAKRIEKTQITAHNITESQEEKAVAIAETPSFARDNTLTTPFEAEVRLANIQQWVGIKQSLATVTGLGDIQIRSLSAGRAVVAFRYSGDPESLRRDLAARGLSLYANPVQSAGTSPYIIMKTQG